MSSSRFTVKALFEYTSDHEDDLTFAIGQVITVTEEEDEEWFYGEYTDESGIKNEGLFPRNFVEKYEPPAPPRPSRPSRPRKEADAAPPVAVSSSQDVQNESARGSLDSERAMAVDTAPQSQPIPEPEPAPVKTTSTAATEATPTQPAPSTELPEKAESAPKAAPKPSPPAVAEKPTTSSFRDRIAAFNKPAAAPVTPLNPDKSTSSNSFIKKPFVAPPPSKNAYVPPVQTSQPPPKVYRREEDPEIQERVAEEQAIGERSTVTQEDETAEEDKPTSLKERIALLQKQQLEQAQRHAESAQKKEKPKKPQKKSSDPESQEQPPAPHIIQEPELEKTRSTESAEIRSRDAPEPDVSDDHTHRSPVAPVVPSPMQPPRELTSDTNDADHSGAGDTEEADETSTSKEDLSEGPGERKLSIREKEGAEPAPTNAQQEEGEDEVPEKVTEEDEEMDPEVKRRMEIRDRMAKMSGGMGMMGMFGPPGGMPGMASGGQKKPKSQPTGESARKSSEEPRAVPGMQAPPVPVMGMQGAQKKEHTTAPADVEQDDGAQLTPVPTAQPQSPTSEAPLPNVSRAPPPPPHQEPVAPPPPPESTRPVPPPVPGGRRPSHPSTAESQTTRPSHRERSVSPSVGEESDDELSGAGARAGRGPPGHAGYEEPPQLPQRSFTGEAGVPPQSPPSASDKRFSRGPPPPPPGASPPLPAPSHNRPPPPPPSAPVSRKSTSDSRVSISGAPSHGQKDDIEEEVTEYDGDYDTDIASGAKHKDALKAHGRDSSLDESTITDDFSAQSPRDTHQARPPVPSTQAPRAAPPPPPSQPPKQARKSSEVPRVPPPPIPPPMDPYESPVSKGDDEYDPFRYDASGPPAQTRGEARTVAKTPSEESTPHSAPSAPPPPPPERAAAPPPPPPDSPSLQATRSQPRQSTEVSRGQGSVRRSMDVSRPSVDQGYIANYVDLGQNTLWWAQPNTPPPVFQNRRDILFEIEESSSSDQSGKPTISKDVYVLFMDYSQTIINVQFDAKNPADVALDQRSEPPPPRLRQDQLESSHSQFGTRISDAVAPKQNTTVGDGTPHALVQSLLSPLQDAVGPVGTRAYGALVYANLANASVQQVDEIRAGDIVSFRNARFMGHRGPMHQKYNTEAGKPDHVGVVFDWDGTKKKIRAWEQGRESKKVKLESFKLGDLKSGECRVWRVMPRSWVGWDGGKA